MGRVLEGVASQLLPFRLAVKVAAAAARRQQAQLERALMMRRHVPEVEQEEA